MRNYNQRAFDRAQSAYDRAVPDDYWEGPDDEDEPEVIDEDEEDGVTYSTPLDADRCGYDGILGEG